MKELIAFRKYLTEGVINEEKSIKDEIKRASKIMLTNLISKNPDGWEDDQEEYASLVDSGEFEVIGNMGFLVVSLMLDWSQRKYEEGIYKEVDELLNNYDWDSKFKRYKINEENKTEGVINEESYLDQIRKKYGNSEVVTYNSIFVESGEKYIEGYESWSMSIADILDGIEEDSLEMEMDYEELLEDLEGLTAISDGLSIKDKQELITRESSQSESSLNQNVRVMGNGDDYFEIEDGGKYDEDEVDIYEVGYSVFLRK